MATDLFSAIRRGDGGEVERLLEGDRELIEARDEAGRSPLLAAVYRGQGEIAAAILRREPTLNVFEAAALGNAARVRELVAERPALANAESSDGYSPLGLAAFFKHRDVVRFLLRAGADPRRASRDQGFTPLHSAVATDAGALDVGLAHMLLDSGADANARSGEGATALHTAAFVGDRAAVQLLLEHGADRSVRTRDGRSPLDIARARGNTNLLDLLEERRGEVF